MPESRFPFGSARLPNAKRAWGKAGMALVSPLFHSVHQAGQTRRIETAAGWLVTVNDVTNCFKIELL